MHFIDCGRRLLTPQTLKVMKLTFVLLTVAFLQVGAKGVAQNNVTYSGKKVKLETVFKAIKKQTGFSFFYNVADLEKATSISVELKNTPLEEALTILLKNQPLTFSINGKTIVIKEKPSTTAVFQPADNSLISEPPPPIDITGKVTDADGNPLVGANVKVKGSGKGTTTGNDGVFVLKGIDDNATLEISFVGYETSSVPVNNRTSIITSLRMQVQNLNEVVINKEYYTERKKYTVSNVGKVTSTEIEKQPVTNALLALQGNVSGIQVTQTTGSPGAGVKVRIGLQNSLNNGNGPLYVVDGVPVPTDIPTPGGDYGPLPNSGEQTIGQGSTGRGNALNYINPIDIESIEVLKDADATAIFGSRAANGAILITTKKGKAGESSVTTDFQQGWGQVGHFMKLLTTRQYLEMRHEALNNDAVTPNLNDPFDPGYAADLLLWDTTRYTNWQKSLIGGKAQYTNATVSLSGGTPAIQYLLSTTFHRQTSVFPGNFSDQQGSLHLSLSNNDINQKFHFLFSTNYSVDNNKLPGVDLTSLALLLVPNAPTIYNQDGSLNWMPDANGNSTWFNPLAQYTYKTYEAKTNNLVSSGNLSYNISPQLTIGSRLGYTNLQSDANQLNSLLALKPEDRPNDYNSAFYELGKLNTWSIEPYANFRQKLGKHALEALLGSTLQRTRREAEASNGLNYAYDNLLPVPSAASIFGVVGYLKSLYKYNAVFGRINEVYKGRYIVNLTGRYDGSSRFGSNNRFHPFWSVGGAWIFNQEHFFKSSFLSFGKVRGNYGTSGSDQIGDYRYLTLYSVNTPAVPYQGISGLSPAEIPNPDLQWEETKKLSLGLDLGFLSDKIYLTANYSCNRSSNQLIQYLLPRITGRSNMLMNFPATIQNKSWEFGINMTNIATKDLKWTTNLNLTIPRNKLIRFPNNELSSYHDRLKIGQPTSFQKLYHYTGVDPLTGLYTVADSQGKPTLSPNSQTDRTVIISNFSKYYGGLQNTIQFRGIELSFLIQLVQQIAYNPDYGFGYPPGNFYGYYDGSGNQPVSVMSGRWQKPGDKATSQKFTASDFNVVNGLAALNGSDASYKDASYAKLKNLSLSWELPKQFRQKTHLQSCRIYVHGENLLTITKYKGLDPETANFSYLPPLRVIMFGMQIKL
jgi:TonB-linked SusC/RagA family outer membrane protein